MAFEMRKTSNWGTKHPVVARLKVQTCELLQWTNLRKEKRDHITAVYFDAAERLLKSHEIYGRLVIARDAALTEVYEQKDPRVRNVPNVIGLRGELESFLYEGKNFLRELLNAVNAFFQTEFHEASDFVDLSEKNSGKVLAWTIQTFGRTSDFASSLLSDQEWIRELIRKRNAVEHPGGRSGTLMIDNFRIMHDGTLVHPVWRRGLNLSSYVFPDLENCLHNMLTFGEDLLASCVKHSGMPDLVEFAEISENNRSPSCPERLMAQLKVQSVAPAGK
jgi:hypothetical protein